MCDSSENEESVGFCGDAAQSMVAEQHCCYTPGEVPQNQCAGQCMLEWDIDSACSNGVTITDSCSDLDKVCCVGGTMDTEVDSGVDTD